MKLFFRDLNELISTDLNNIEVFYFASLIYLRSLDIHPFRDGNGRAAPSKFPNSETDPRILILIRNNP